MSETETKLQSRIVKMLRRMGVWVIRINSGMSFGAQGGRVRGADEGTPDLNLPALGWLECKLPGKTLSPAQVRWHGRARREGVRVAVVRYDEEAAEVVVGWISADALKGRR